MAGETASDELAEQRFAAFQADVGERVDAVRAKHGVRREAVEQVIRAKGYEPEELGWIIGAAGATGSPGKDGSVARALEAHREVLEAVANELGVDLEEPTG